MKYNKKLKVDGIITAKNIEIIKKNSLTSVEPWGELNQGSDTDLDAATLNGKRPENFAKKVHTHNYLETTHNYDKSAHPDIIKLIEETENILGKPSIIKPQPNSIYAGEIIGTDIEYLTEKYNGAHLSTTWEISLNDKFTSLIYSSYNDTFNINKLMMGDYIKPNIIYYIRIKYQTEYFETPWSDIVKFKSQEKIVYAPTITFSDNFDCSDVKSDDTYDLNLDFKYQGADITYLKTIINIRKDGIVSSKSINVLSDNYVEKLPDIFNFYKEIEISIYHITNIGNGLELYMKFKKKLKGEKIEYKSGYISSSTDYFSIDPEAKSLIKSNSNWSSGTGKVYLDLERSECGFNYHRWGSGYSWITSPNSGNWYSFGKRTKIANDCNTLYISEPNTHKDLGRRGAVFWQVGRILTYKINSNHYVEYLNEFSLPNSISYSQLGNRFLDISDNNKYMCTSVQKYIDKFGNIQNSNAVAMAKRDRIDSQWQFDTFIENSDLAKFYGNTLYVSKNTNDTEKSLNIYEYVDDKLDLMETVKTRFLESRNFAKSFDTNNMYLVVGAPDDYKFNSGLVYIYERKDNMWKIFKKLYPPNEMYIKYGYNVCISDDSTVFLTSDIYNKPSEILIYSYNDDLKDWKVSNKIENETELIEDAEIFISKDKSTLVTRVNSNQKIIQYCLTNKKLKLKNKEEK